MSELEQAFYDHLKNMSNTPKPFDVRDQKTPDLDWVKRLPEVGRPINTQVDEIRDNLRDAREAFDRAELQYAQAIDHANEREGELMDEIAGLWTAQEIDLAKRGKILVHGIEADYE